MSTSQAPKSWLTQSRLGRFCLIIVVVMGMAWGCASPVARAPTLPPPPAPPSLPPPPGAVEPIPTPPPVPGGSRVPPARHPPSTPAMVASAQWVEEGIRSIDAGDYNRATTLLERAISVEPNNGRAFYYYGMAMGERGNPSAALNLLRKAEILLRGDARALGDVYAQMGLNEERLKRLQQARQRYGQALAQNPDQALARRRLQALGGAER
ncbi:MAG TPA: tetratricopeptide repeat protein [Alphaproteobacteria bacterium]|nr:tetratricopeptide repeat protein [Alphaproteobacteria bacterium]